MPVVYQVLKERLEAERSRLLAELEQKKAVASGENLGYGNHMADDATAAFDQARDLALRNNQQRLLEQIDQALARFADQSYGRCQSCNQLIDPARLKALPHASYCFACQKKQEH